MIVGAGPAGLALAAAAWFILGGGNGMSADLDRLELRLAAAKPPAQHAFAAADSVARAAATPLFGLTTGPGAVADISVALQGLAVTPTRKAALVSIGGKPSDWLDLGATRDGVTLMTVQSNKITVDTATGFKDVGLWDQSANTSGPPSPSNDPQRSVVSGSDHIPPGAYVPPAPASAPGHGG